MDDLVIKNGWVVTPSGIIAGGLTVKNGKIAHIGGSDSLPDAAAEIDADWQYVLPGIIDTHVHLGTALRPGEEFIPELRAESETAATCGVTTLVTTTTYPQHEDRRVRKIDLHREKKREGTHNSFVDFKFTHWIYSDEDVEDLQQLFVEGCTSYKFIAQALELVDHGELGQWGFMYGALRRIGQLGEPAMALMHCEQEQIIRFLQKELIEQGRTDLPAWTEARPPITEAIDALSLGLVGKEVGCPVCVVHIGSWQTVEAVKWLRQMGAKVVAETCPAYLALTKNEPLGNVGKANPPLKDETHIEKLWQAVSEGAIDIIGSDHSPKKLKPDKLEPTLWKARPGVGGNGVILPILITEGVKKGRIGMEDVARLTGENAARAFGIYPTKGVLASGSDADIIIVDPEGEWVLGLETLKGLSDYSTWEGKRVRGRAVKTFLRGKLVAEDGGLVDKQPRGEYVEVAQRSAGTVA
jgi:dihydroorotase-like cyclic amidohydrolase